MKKTSRDSLTSLSKMPAPERDPSLLFFLFMGHPDHSQDCKLLWRTFACCFEYSSVLFAAISRTYVIVVDVNCLILIDLPQAWLVRLTHYLPLT